MNSKTSAVNFNSCIIIIIIHIISIITLQPAKPANYGSFLHHESCPIHLCGVLTADFKTATSLPWWIS